MNLGSMISNVCRSQKLKIIAKKSNSFENARQVFLSIRQEIQSCTALPLSRTIKGRDSGALVTEVVDPSTEQKQKLPQGNIYLDFI